MKCSAGPPPEISPLLLSKKGSLYLTRPTVAHYYSDPGEVEEGFAALFEVVASGRVRPYIGARIPLREAAEAHRRLEARETVGSTVLLP